MAMATVESIEISASLSEPVYADCDVEEEENDKSGWEPSAPPLPVSY
jgi:hypothetical protein